MARLWLLAVLLASIVACTSATYDDPCPWLSGDNCWKAALVAAAPCLHDASVVGVLAADGATCTFDDGVTIAFRKPLDPTDVDPSDWDFSITKDGAACLEYTQEEGDTQTDIALTTPAGTLGVHADRGSYDVDCPDGTSTSFRPLAMLDCEGLFADAPGLAWTGGLTLSFNGGADGAVTAFRCEVPAR